MIEDANLDLATRRARMAAAIADAPRRTSPVIAAMAAGAGAELVAAQHYAREILATRLARREARRGSEGRPSPTSLPDPVPADAAAGALSRKPETSDD